MTATEQKRTRRSPSLPGALSIGLARIPLELKNFRREPDSMVFTFAMPAALLLILGTIFTEETPGVGTSASQIFSASLIAAGAMSTSFVLLGIGIATERDDGTLKRLRLSPTPLLSYLIGKIGLVLIATAAEVLLILGIGVFVFDLELPTTTDRWMTFTWVLLLGTIASALLGIAISNLPRSAKSAAAVILVPFFILQMISGVLFNPLTALPSPLLEIGSIFPLRWMAQGMRSVFLPDAMTVQEVTGEWELGRIAMVLGVWCVLGLIGTMATFRWKTARQG